MLIAAACCFWVNLDPKLTVKIFHVKARKKPVSWVTCLLVFNPSMKRCSLALHQRDPRPRIVWRMWTMEGTGTFCASPSCFLPMKAVQFTIMPRCFMDLWLLISSNIMDLHSFSCYVLFYFASFAHRFCIHTLWHNCFLQNPRSSTAFPAVGPWHQRIRSVCWKNCARAWIELTKQLVACVSVLESNGS